MIFIAILFATAFFLSAVAAYYSIIGLVAIFPTAVIPIVVMGVSLELAKLVAASWLYRNWNDSPISLKYYFTSAVVILSFITSMGIFGFLSKAHIDQTAVGSDSLIELKIIDDQIAVEKRRIENAQRSLTALDRLVDESDTEAAVKIRNQQRRERTSLAAEISSASNEIKTLNTAAAPLRKESKKIIAEVGPLKFIADLIYGDSDTATLEKAVRAVIILIVFVFDPLAIILLIAANRELKLYKRPVSIRPEDVSEITIDDSQIEDFTDKIKTPKQIKSPKDFTVSKRSEIPKELLDKVFKRNK